jgi:HD-like signal output (HDOD) protein
MMYDVSTSGSWDRFAAAEDPDEHASADDFVTAFRFVQSLTRELTRGRVELPSPPVVAERVARALDRDDLGDTILTRIVASDAGLAVRLLELAHGRSQEAGPYDLKLAVVRMGREKLRKVTLPYLAQKLRSDAAFAHIRGELLRLWERGIHVAAIARVLARRTGAAPPDLAMIAGLLHNIGSVFMLARAQRELGLFRKPAIRDVMLNDWQSQVSKAIAQNWKLPDVIVAAIGDQNTLDRHDAGDCDLTDVLGVAVVAACYDGRHVELELALADVPAFQRLGLGHAALRAAIAESAVELASLRSALGE